MTAASIAHRFTPRDDVPHGVPRPGRTPEKAWCGPRDCPSGAKSGPEYFTQRVAALGHLLQVRIDQALSAEGITARQFNALEHIAKDPELHRASLARILHTSPSPQAAAGLTRRLHDRGLLERLFVDPWRPITFAITEAGTQCLARARPIVAAVERDVLSHLPEQLAADLSDGALGLVHGVDWLSDPQGLVDEVSATMKPHASGLLR